MNKRKLHFSIAIRFTIRGAGFWETESSARNKNSTASPAVKKPANEYAVDNEANVIYRNRRLYK